MNRLAALVELLRERTRDELLIIRGAVLAVMYPRRRRYWTIARPGPAKIVGGVGRWERFGALYDTNARLGAVY